MYSYSTNPSLNLTIGGVSLAEGWGGNLVNDSERAFVAEICKWRNDMSGVPVSSGTNALVINTASALTALADGNLLCFRAGNTNTAGCTAQINSTAAKAVKTIVNGVLADIPAGGIVKDMRYLLSLDLSNNRYLLLNPTPPAAAAAAAATPVGFRARKTSTQSINSSTFTKVTWSSESFDYGSDFASNGWTPPEGLVMLGLCVQLTTISAGDVLVALIYKNGSVLSRNMVRGPATGGVPVQAETNVVDYADGSDVYEAYAWQDTGASRTIDDSTGFTQFWGAKLL